MVFGGFLVKRFANILNNYIINKSSNQGSKTSRMLLSLKLAFSVAQRFGPVPLWFRIWDYLG
jgi:hypothetical protein